LRKVELMTGAAPQRTVSWSLFLDLSTQAILDRDLFSVIKQHQNERWSLGEEWRRHCLFNVNDQLPNMVEASPRGRESTGSIQSLDR
jgi:hypothetical protein